MSRLNVPRVFPIAFLLASALVLVACAGPAPTPGAQTTPAPTAKPSGGTPTPLASTLLPPSKTPGLATTLVGTPGKPGIATTMALPAPTTAPVSFSKDILPLFRERCAACHINQSMGGLSLKDYDSLTKGGQRGPAVVKGNPDASLLIRKLRGDAAVGARMPSGGPYLPDDTIRKVADWIRQGAANN